MKRVIEKLKTMPYAQAHTETIDGVQYLFSYRTLVATYRKDNDGTWIRCYGLYSASTRKHISAFARQNGLTFKDFKDIANEDYELNVDTGEVILEDND